MVHTTKIISTIIAVLSLSLLSACGTSTPTSIPTPDLNPIRTEVAATVLAQVSQTLSLAPSSTPVPSVTATSTLTSTPTQAAGAAVTPQATLTSSAPLTGTLNLAEWVSQSIPDGTVFAPGETFTITWRMKNTGTSTWTADYLLRFYSGVTFGAPKEIQLGRIVLPGETVDISVKMSAPALPGDYRTDWVLSNESRSNFKQPVFLKITVAIPPTPTRSATAAP
jgi:hypothetical protein